MDRGIRQELGAGERVCVGRQSVSLRFPAPVLLDQAIIIPLYPTKSTSPPFRAMESAWYCIRGLRPMSPRTRTTTRGFASLLGVYRVGRHSTRTAVKDSEAISRGVAHGSSANMMSMPEKPAFKSWDVRIKLVS
jgi:hypothetical protein